jgi:RNA polymerase sigma-70 factor (ECF subfamily)
MSTHPEPPSTFGAFARRWRPVLLEYASEVLGDSDLIEDVAQTVLLKVLTAGGWDDIESPKAYCRRAAYREALRELESQRRSEPLQAVEPHARSTAPDPWEITVRREDRARLEACLRRLPERCAAVMTLKLMEGLTGPEIANRLRIGLGGVEKQVTRGNRLLRQWVSVGPEGELVWVSSFEDGGGLEG